VSDASETPPNSPGGGVFATTRWSLIAQATAADSPEARSALEELCRAYWHPLYSFVRRGGRSPEDAQDLTQSFFARLLEHDYLARADHGRGRFRTFLLTSLRNFLADEHARATAAKRGGGRPILSLDVEEAEAGYLAAAMADDVTPEQLFERRWAFALIERSLVRLRGEYAARGRGEVFDRLQELLWGDATTTVSIADVSAELGQTENATRVAVHRLRERFGEVVRSEIAETVESPAEIQGELEHLFAALGR
jgi:DNA-directed RNA polymerase specialized sigma24 family protein